VREAGGVTILAHPGTLNRDHLIPTWPVGARRHRGMALEARRGRVEYHRGFAQLHGLP
jgi:hypothetical protein